MKAEDIKTETPTGKDVHTEALERFKLIMDVEEDQRNLAIEDIKFAQTSQGQWDDVGDEEKADEPRFTINKVAPNLAQIVGEQRQNDVSIRVRPTGGGADKELAETYNGLIRNIENVSKADRIYSGAFSECINGGYGGMYLTTEYSDADPFVQIIRIKQIKGATTTMFFDPDALEDDKTDSMYGFRLFNMGTDRYNATYPENMVTDWENLLLPNGLNHHWFRKDGLMLAHYYRKIPVKLQYVLFGDGTIKQMDEIPEGLIYLRERTVTEFKVEHYLMNGSEILEGPDEWAGSYIPMIPVYGETMRIEEQEFVRGKVRFAKDPARMHNYAKSAILTTAALSPLDPYWMTQKQAVGHEAELANMNVDKDPVYFYNADPDNPGPPKRTGGPIVQEALIGIANSSEADIQATMGVVPGQPGIQEAMRIDPRSGKAIQEAGQRGDVGNYVYYDNLSVALECVGTQLLDLIPKVMDTPRQERILGRDGSEEIVWVNREGMDDKGNRVIENDLSKGVYDVVVDTGPAFATQRMEAVEKLMSLAETNPIFGDLSADLVAKNLDVPNSEELYERTRKLMIAKGQVEPTEEERKEYRIDEREAMKQQLYPEVLEAVQQDATVQALLAQAENFKASAMEKQSKIPVNAATVDKTTSDASNKDYQSNQLAIESLKTLLESMQEKVDMGITLTGDDINDLMNQTTLIKGSQREAIDNM